MTRRKIKFRCWDIEDKDWLDDDHFVYLNGNLVAAGCNMNLILDEDYYTVQQYTGVKDIDGNEIYEGDICEHDNLGAMEIKWVRCEFVAKSADGKFITTVNGKWLKVVGNIYENPTLINIK